MNQTANRISCPASADVDRWCSSWKLPYLHSFKRDIFYWAPRYGLQVTVFKAVKRRFRRAQITLEVTGPAQQLQAFRAATIKTHLCY